MSERENKLIAQENELIEKIAKLLDEWGLIEVIDEFEEDEPMLGVNKIKIISHKEKSEWEMIPKYHIGNS